MSDDFQIKTEESRHASKRTKPASNTERKGGEGKVVPFACVCVGLFILAIILMNGFRGNEREIAYYEQAMRAITATMGMLIAVSSTFFMVLMIVGKNCTKWLPHWGFLFVVGMTLYSGQGVAVIGVSLMVAAWLVTRVISGPKHESTAPDKSTEAE